MPSLRETLWTDVKVEGGEELLVRMGFPDQSVIGDPFKRRGRFGARYHWVDKPHCTG
jgi:hypothetical protein